MEKFADKFEPLAKDSNVFKTISKQLNRQGVMTQKNWYKNIRGMSVYNANNEKVLVLMLYNTKTKEFFSTCSVCHDIDTFNPEIGLKICASRMAKHTDFVNSIKVPNITDLACLIAQEMFKPVG